MANVYTGTMNGAVQTGYFVGTPPGFPGLQTFIENNHTVNSYPVEEDFIHCGRGVVRGTDNVADDNVYGADNSPFGIALPDAGSTASDFVGILLRDQSARNDANGQAGKRRQDMAAVLEEGYCFVELHQDVEAKGDVYMIVKAENALGAPLGAFVADDADGAAIAVSRLAWWATCSRSARQYGVIRIFSK